MRIWIKTKLIEIYQLTLIRKNRTKLSQISDNIGMILKLRPRNKLDKKNKLIIGKMSQLRKYKNHKSKLLIFVNQILTLRKFHYHLTWVWMFPQLPFKLNQSLFPKIDKNLLKRFRIVLNHLFNKFQHNQLLNKFQKLSLFILLETE